MVMNHVNYIKLARGLFNNANNIFSNKVMNKPMLIQNANISKTPQDIQESDEEFSDRFVIFNILLSVFILILAHIIK